MIFGIGTDIIEIERIQKAIDRHPQFLSHILTPKELAHCAQLTHKESHVAGRFAAKEAVAKALGTGIVAKLYWHDIEIITTTEGKPEVFLSEKGSRHFPGKTFHLSISHCREYATAVCVVLN